MRISRKLTLLFLCFAVLGGASVFAKDISKADDASLTIDSRTSFIFDLDHTYRYGLSSEFINFDLDLKLVPYQALTNRVKSPDPVGFINVTLFDLDLVIAPSWNGGDSTATNPPGGTIPGWNGPAALTRGNYQTGTFQAGIAAGDFIVQLNAGANEPFMSPWNKAYEYISDGVKFSWAYLDSMVDVVRVNTIDQIVTGTGGPEARGKTLVKQYTQDNAGISDTLGFNYGTDTGGTVALMYNSGDFGFDFKAHTQYGPYDANITATNANGLVFGADAVFTPKAVAGFKTILSAIGTANYGADANSDPEDAGIKVAYDIPLDEATSIEPYVGFDGMISIPDASAADQTIPFTWELAGGVTMHWPGKGGWYTDYLLDVPGRVFPGMSLAVKYYNNPAATVVGRMDGKFTLFEEKGDEGLFYGLGSEIIVDWTNFLNPDATDNKLLATVYLDYQLPSFAGGQGILDPWTILLYDNLPGATAGTRDNNFKVDLGVKLIGAISNVTFNLGWYSGELANEAPITTASVVAGVVKLSADISF